MRILFVIAALVLVSRPATGQTPGKPVSFEVASVKPATAPIQTKDEYSAGYNAGLRSALASFGIRVTGQRVNITDNSLKDLIRLAYEVKDYQISAPSWMAAEKYEIVANMPAGTNRSQAPEMLRSLLESRLPAIAPREQEDRRLRPGSGEEWAYAEGLRAVRRPAERQHLGGGWSGASASHEFRDVRVRRSADQGGGSPGNRRNRSGGGVRF